MMTFLIFPSFLAGVLMFLAPCTFPLLPAYISFIGGTSVNELKHGGSGNLRRKVFLNGLLYVLGFSVVFIVLGTVFGLGGSALSQYRSFLSMVGGVLIIFFGLYIAGVLKITRLDYQKTLASRFSLQPGRPLSAFLFGGTFALGWTPCVGPILGAVLTLAATRASVWQGAFLLFVFSAGLALPFLLIAAGGGWALSHARALNKYLGRLSVIGGVLLIVLGLLLLTNEYQNAINYFYRFDPFGFSALLKYY